MSISMDINRDLNMPIYKNKIDSKINFNGFKPKVQNQSLSFGKLNPLSKISSGLQTATSGLIKKMDQHGYIADFLVADLLGCIIPRVNQEYHRNKEELGHPNYQAAVEVTGRELLSGWSLALIPLIMVAVAGKTLGKGVLPKVANIEKLSDAFKKVLEHPKHTASDVLNNQEGLAREFFEEVFNRNFKEHIQTGKHVDVINETRKTFVGHFEALSNNKKGKKDAVKGLRELTEQLNLQFNINADNPRSTKMLDEPIDILSRDAVNYASGVLNKLSKKLTPNDNKNSVNETFEDIKNFNIGARKILNFSTFGSIAAFWLFMPLLYNQSKQNPGVAGLKKETNSATVNIKSKANSDNKMTLKQRPVFSHNNKLTIKSQNTDNNNRLVQGILNKARINSVSSSSNQGGLA